jgi:predicted Fe-Mo cluster-binding NifX family protein
MKIAVTSNQEGLDQAVEERFGRCAIIAIFDTDTEALSFVPNLAKDASSGAGVKAAQQLMDLDVDLLITGKVGPGALEVLNEGDIKVESWTAGTVREAIERFGGKRLE